MSEWWLLVRAGPVSSWLLALSSPPALLCFLSALASSPGSCPLLTTHHFPPLLQLISSRAYPMAGVFDLDQGHPSGELSLQAMLMALCWRRPRCYPTLPGFCPKGTKPQILATEKTQILHFQNRNWWVPQSANFLPTSCQGKQWFASQMEARRTWQWHSGPASLTMDSPALFGIWSNELKRALGNDHLRALSEIQQKTWVLLTNDRK